MVKISINYFLILLVTVLASCSKSEDNGSPIDNGGGPSSNTYWPLAVGNIWNMVNTDDPGDKSEYYLHKTLIHEGKTYYQFKPEGTDLDVHLNIGIREDNGVVYEYHGASSQMGVNTSAGVITSLNTKLAVGEVWTDQVTLNISGAASGTLKHTNEGKILAKTTSVAVNGKTYKDVIKTETKKTVRNSITGYSLTIIYEAWLAKGVGLIYEKNNYDNEVVEQYKLTSYSLN